MVEKGALSHSIPDPGQPGPWVVLVHYGDPAVTADCVRTLASVETHPHGVVVVDHGPAPGLEGVLRGLHPRLRVLHHPENPGFGAGCNRGAEAALEAGATSLWFLNNDARPEEPILAHLETLGSAHPEVCLWGTWQLDGEARLGVDQQPPWFALGLHPVNLVLPEGFHLLGPRETLSGASIFLTSRAWEHLGPWPEHCFVYYEDTEWCRRAHARGLPMALAPFTVVHPRGTTLGRRSRLSVFYGVRNQLRLHRALHPKAGGRRLLMALHLLQKRVFQGRWGLLRPTLDAYLASRTQGPDRDPRY